MKLISTELGKVVQLFVLDEIRPLSGLNMPEFIRLIQERYGFAKVRTEGSRSVWCKVSNRTAKIEKQDDQYFGIGGFQ